MAAFNLTVMGLSCHMYATAGSHNGPHWDPAGSVPFRTWIREVQAWLNVTSARMQPSQQAAAIQLGLRGVAREFALSIPPAAISFGAVIEGVATDPVTYLLYTLGDRFEALEDERTMTSGTLLLDFSSRPGEGIDSVITRFDMARYEAQSVGADIRNFHTLSTILLRAVGVTSTQMIMLLHPLGGRMPVDQRQCDQLMSQLRSMGHIMERTPGNIGEVLRTGSSRAYVTETTLHADGYAAVPSDAAPTTNNRSPDGAGNESGWYSGNGVGWNAGNTWNTNTYTSYGQDADGYDSGTDSDTASSCGDRDYDYSDIAHLSEEVQQQELFWAMEHAKGRWRQFSRKPVRKVRRFFRRTMKGKGKGKSGKRVSGKGVSTFTMSLPMMSTKRCTLEAKAREKEKASPKVRGHLARGREERGTLKAETAG